MDINSHMASLSRLSITANAERDTAIAFLSVRPSSCPSHAGVGLLLVLTLTALNKIPIGT